MKLYITAKPNAKRNHVEKIDESHYRVWVKARPQEGAANQAVIEMLSQYFCKPKSAFTFLCGTRSRHKMIGMKG